jgi:hypothetical protein
MYRIEGVQFDYDRADPMKQWRIYSPDTSIDLTFRPLGMHQSARGIGPLWYALKQPFGIYSGTIRAGDTACTIENMVGIAEEHLAKW